jgi:hypothetical protein
MNLCEDTTIYLSEIERRLKIEVGKTRMEPARETPEDNCGTRAGELLGNAAAPPDGKQIGAPQEQATPDDTLAGSNTVGRKMGRPSGKVGEETTRIREAWNMLGRPKTTDKVCDQIAKNLGLLTKVGKGSKAEIQIRGRVRSAIHRYQTGLTTAS